MRFRAIKLKYDWVLRGRIGWQNLRSDEFTDEGPYLVTGMHFDNGEVDWERCFHVSEDRYAQDRDIQIREGDVLITKDGSIGKLAHIARLPGPACLNSHLLLLRPRVNKYVPRFLYWLLQSDDFRVYTLQEQSGTTFFGITQASISNYKASFPGSAVDQERIASHLDKATSQADELIEKKQRLIELLEEKRAALISRAVTQGLDPGVPMKDSGVEWLGRVPAPGPWRPYMRDSA